MKSQPIAVEESSTTHKFIGPNMKPGTVTPKESWEAFAAHWEELYPQCPYACVAMTVEGKTYQVSFHPSRRSLFGTKPPQILILPSIGGLFRRNISSMPYVFQRFVFQRIGELETCVKSVHSAPAEVVELISNRLNSDEQAILKATPSTQISVG